MQRFNLLSVLLLFTLASIAGCVENGNVPAGTSTSLDAGSGLETVGLYYDDGSFEGKMAFTAANATLAVKFTPQRYPFTIEGVRYHISDNPRQFIVRLMDDDGYYGSPGSDMIQPFAAEPAGRGWHTAELDYAITSGSFYVGMTQLGANESWLGSDQDAPHELRGWVDMNGSWAQLKDIGYQYDLGIQVVGMQPTPPTTTTVYVSTTTSMTSSTSTTSSSSISTTTSSSTSTSTSSSTVVSSTTSTSSVPVTSSTSTTSSTTSSSTTSSSTTTSSTSTSTVILTSLMVYEQNCYQLCKDSYGSTESRCYADGGCVIADGVWVRDSRGDWDCTTSNPNRKHCCCLQDDAVELSYDDSGFEGKVGFSGGSGMLGVKFTPARYPFTLTGVRFHVMENPSEVEIAIYGVGADGKPGVPLAKPAIAAPSGLGWANVDLAYELRSGDFFIVLRPEVNGSWIGADYGRPVYGRGWINLGGEWMSLGSLGYEYDLGLRVYGVQPPATITSTSVTSTLSTVTSTSSTTTTSIIVLTEEPVLRFLPGLGKCDREKAGNISSADGKIVFSGALEAEMPCYTLTSMLYAENENLTVRITAQAANGTCILCASEIPFSGEIGGLITGAYNVRILDENTTLLEDTVYVTLRDSGGSILECVKHSDCPGDYYGPYLCVNDMVVRSNYYNLCVESKCVRKVRNHWNESLDCVDVSLRSSGFDKMIPVLATMMPYGNGTFELSFSSREDWNVSGVQFAGDCQGSARGPIMPGALFPVVLSCPEGGVDSPYIFELKVLYTLKSGSVISQEEDSGTLRGIYI